jgi:hypothetical protein
LTKNLGKDDHARRPVEQWVGVPDFPQYMVSDLGRVQNLDFERQMTIHVNAEGVAYVRLVQQGKATSRSVALLVARAFLPVPKFESFDTPINLNGDRLNNEISNLMWRPRWFAIKYHRQLRELPAAPRAIIHLLETKETFVGPRAAATKYGLLEREIIVDLTNQEGVWPTGQVFSL